MNDYRQLESEMRSVAAGFSSHTLCKFTGSEYRIPESRYRRNELEERAVAKLVGGSAPYLEPRQLYNLGRLHRKKEFYGR